MKYMGSKRAMLHNGLGDLLDREVINASRFVDLFAGSGSVAIYIARKFPIPVLAFDLQSYSVILTAAVVSRKASLNWLPIWKKWQKSAVFKFKSIKIPIASKINRSTVSCMRRWSNEQIDLPVTKAYGGHYFSAQQAVWIDAFRNNLPSWEPAKTVALASLIQAASQCAASPGHTAQPFQPTLTARRFINEAWKKNLVEKTRICFKALANQFALCPGKAIVDDANQAVRWLREDDLVFIDPPYSGVQYSRFYHVLETITQGTCGEVSGVGRYPAFSLRPRSRYSVVSESSAALNELLKIVASQGAHAILTFPDQPCSNGLSGDDVRKIAGMYFSIRENQITSKFSTLGGTGGFRGNKVSRSARKHTQELMLVLKNRK